MRSPILLLKKKIPHSVELPSRIREWIQLDDLFDWSRINQG